MQTRARCTQILAWSVQEGNAGLVKQALAARQMRQTQRLTQTYLTLSLADIARHIGLASPQEAEQHILRRVLLSLRASCAAQCMIESSLPFPYLLQAVVLRLPQVLPNDRNANAIGINGCYSIALWDLHG